MKNTPNIIEDLRTITAMVADRVATDPELDAVQLYTVVVFNDGSQVVVAPTEEQASMLHEAIDIASDMQTDNQVMH